MRAATAHGLEYEFMPSTSTASFANSETTTVHQTLNIWFLTTPPMCTIVDIVEQGRVPILFSLQQTKILNMRLDMRPDNVLITCEALGFNHVQATQSSSSHIVVDLVAILRVPARAPCNSYVFFPSFFAGDSEIGLGTCPACAGRRRPRMYTEGCKQEK